MAFNLSDWTSGSSELGLDDSDGNLSNDEDIMSRDLSNTEIIRVEDPDMMVSPDLQISRKPSRDPPDHEDYELRSSSKSNSPASREAAGDEETAGSKRKPLSPPDSHSSGANSITTSEKRRSGNSKYMGANLVNLVKQFNTEAEKILHEKNTASADPQQNSEHQNVSSRGVEMGSAEDQQGASPSRGEVTNLIRNFNDEAERILYETDPPDKVQADPPTDDEEDIIVESEGTEEGSPETTKDDSPEDENVKQEKNQYDSTKEDEERSSLEEQDGPDEQSRRGRDPDVEEGLARNVSADDGSSGSKSSSESRSSSTTSRSSQGSNIERVTAIGEEDQERNAKDVAQGDFSRSLEGAEESESSHGVSFENPGDDEGLEQPEPIINVARSVAFDPVPEGSDESSSDDDVSTLSSDAKKAAAKQRQQNCMLLVILIVLILAAIGLLLYFVLADDESSDSSPETVAPTFPGPDFGDDCVFLASVDDLEEAIVKSDGAMINICYAPLFFDREIFLEPSQPGGKVVVNLNCSGTCIFDGEDSSRFFRLGSADFPIRKPVDFDLKFTNIVFQNGNGGDGSTRSNGGGAFQLTGLGTAKATFEDCVFDRNRATFSSGGAIYMENIHTSPEMSETSSLEFINCQFSENTANRGGAISASDVDITLEKTSLQFNIGFGGFEQGGAIFLDNKYPEEVTVTCVGDENNFIDNEASDIWGPSENCDIRDTPPPPTDQCTKLANSTVEALEEIILSAKGSQVNLCNTALSFDREIVLQPDEEGVVSLSLSCPGGCVFAGNSDTKFFRVATNENFEPSYLFFVNFERIIFQNGGASNVDNGGALELIGLGNSVARVHDCTFRGNRAIDTNGGAIFMLTSSIDETIVDPVTNATTTEQSNPGLLEIKDSGFLLNEAYNGGAIAGMDITISVEGTYFRENRASGNFQGGAIYIGHDEYPRDDILITCVGDDNEFTDNVENDIVGPSVGCGVSEVLPIR